MEFPIVCYLIFLEAETVLGNERHTMSKQTRTFFCTRIVRIRVGRTTTNLPLWAGVSAVKKLLVVPGGFEPPRRVSKTPMLPLH